MDDGFSEPQLAASDAQASATQTSPVQAGNSCHPDAAYLIGVLDVWGQLQPAIQSTGWEFRVVLPAALSPLIEALRLLLGCGDIAVVSQPA